jgi:hypothetical protein
MRISHKKTSTVFELEKDLVGDESILFQTEIKKSVANGQTHFCFQLSGPHNMDPNVICALMALKKQFGDAIEFKGENNAMIVDLIVRSFGKN